MDFDSYQDRLSKSGKWDLSGLSALSLNCTLKRTPGLSHTQGLIDMSATIMKKNGVSVEVLRPVDHDIASGVYPDMTRAFGGPENDLTNRNTSFMTRDLLHMARMLRGSGGILPHGNQRSEWDAGCRSDHPNPEYR